MGVTVRMAYSTERGDPGSLKILTTTTLTSYPDSQLMWGEERSPGGKEPCMKCSCKRQILLAFRVNQCLVR